MSTALGLSKVRNKIKEVEPLDGLPDPSVDTGPAEAVEVGQTADAVAEAPAAAKDDFDLLGDMIEAKAGPSINETPAPVQPEAVSITAEKPTEASAPAAAESKREETDAPADEEEAARIAEYAKSKGVSLEEAAQYFARERAMQVGRQAGLSQDEARRAADDDSQRKIMEQAMRAGAGGGGSAVGAIVGGIAAAVKGTVNLVGKGASAAGKLRKGKVDNSPAAVRERTFDHWYDGYNASLDGLGKAGDDMKARVGEFNAAFMNTEAAARLRKMAADGGQDLDAFMSDLNEGRGSKEALAAAREAMSHPAVAQAWEKVSEAESRADSARDGILSNFEKVAKNFPDRVDMGIEADRIEEANEGFMKDLKKPVFEGRGKEASESAEEQQKKFMERMKEIAESIRQMVERILARFGLGPKR